MSDQATPIPMVLYCPHCHKQHIEKGKWVTTGHRTHQCEFCGQGWTPSAHRTTGVRYEDLKFDPIDEPPRDLGHCHICAYATAVGIYMGVPHCNRCLP